MYIRTTLRNIRVRVVYMYTVLRITPEGILFTMLYTNNTLHLKKVKTHSRGDVVYTTEVIYANVVTNVV